VDHTDEYRTMPLGSGRKASPAPIDWRPPFKRRKSPWSFGERIGAVVIGLRH